MSSVDLGNHYITHLLKDPNIADEMRDLLTNTFMQTEQVSLELKPDVGVLVVHGRENVAEVKLPVKQLPQYIGQFKVSELLREARHWTKEAYSALRKFKNTEEVYLVYYPDYKILKIATTDDLLVEYVTHVIWSIE